MKWNQQKQAKYSEDKNGIQGNGKFIPDIFISGINTPICVQLWINNSIFVLGKSDSCDGVLSFNDEISREHCKIVWHDRQYWIVDLNSTNNTCINDEVLVPNVEYPLRVGDQLKLSTSTFAVERIYSISAR